MDYDSKLKINTINTINTVKKSSNKELNTAENRLNLEINKDTLKLFKKSMLLF